MHCEGQMEKQRRLILTAWGLSIAGSAAACGGEPGTEKTGNSAQASVTTPQTALDGSAIPQFVLPLPTLSGTRVNGTATVQVDMVEFQQKVLPASFYPASGQFAAGTFLWGY